MILYIKKVKDGFIGQNSSGGIRISYVSSEVGKVIGQVEIFPLNPEDLFGMNK